MFGLPIAFGAPAVLAGLLALPVIWWLLRMTPPRPQTEVFPPLRILARVLQRDETPSKSPWWLTALRLLLAALVIFALAEPVLNPRDNLASHDGPLLLFVDNSWATAPDWEQRLEKAQALVDDADAAGLAVALVFSADEFHNATPASASTARERLRAAEPRPIFPKRLIAAEALAAAVADSPVGTLAVLSDGISSQNDVQAMAFLASINASAVHLVESSGTTSVVLNAVQNDTDRIRIMSSRLKVGFDENRSVTAYDNRGRPIATGTIAYEGTSSLGNGAIEAPFELRNDFARITIDQAGTAGSSFLLDDSFRRRRVALLSGEPLDLAQPLLSPLYYINRALEPYAELLQPEEPELAAAIPELLTSRPSVIVMADIGTLPEDAYRPLRQWLENGGTLLRFAGPRLAGAASDDPLVPVRLRQGERSLGGSLSWTDPQPLAEFSKNSAFAGLPRPNDVLVNRQVLAEPSADLSDRTWASLADGTPLVTAQDVGAGRIVLFHVTAEASWSNLPLSGSFVEMLRRVVRLSSAGGASSNASEEILSYPPFRVLNANGVLVKPSGATRPLEIVPGELPDATNENPPGLYGTEDAFIALNLMSADTSITSIEYPDFAAPVTMATYVPDAATPLKPTLFSGALILLLIDSLIVLFMAGALRPRIRAGSATASNFLMGVVFIGAIWLVGSGSAIAADERPQDLSILNRLDRTHLAYVETGDQNQDRISERGLTGLSNFLRFRTALEPGDPIAVDLERDELSFYPMIYWPISVDAPFPSTNAVSRIDAFMKSGGTVLFDTRDQLSSLAGTSAATTRLQQILASLDIPPLEPVPSAHVLTKAFFLLDEFPGRFRGSPLWVEALPESDDDADRPARAGDGVSSIIITGNDFAGAWAVDENNIPMFPTIPADPVQREHAFRTGVNIMMYMLTGNYKADQVHIPALLERLGQ